MKITTWTVKPRTTWMAISTPDGSAVVAAPVNSNGCLDPSSTNEFIGDNRSNCNPPGQISGLCFTLAMNSSCAGLGLPGRKKITGAGCAATLTQSGLQ
jgi:hypothetical protein